MTLYWAHLATENFHFDGFGSTDRDARAVLIAGLKQHCKDRGIVWKFFAQDYIDGIAVSPVKTGYVYRDEDSLIYDREKDNAVAFPVIESAYPHGPGAHEHRDAAGDGLRHNHVYGVHTPFVNRELESIPLTEDEKRDTA